MDSTDEIGEISLKLFNAKPFVRTPLNCTREIDETHRIHECKKNRAAIASVTLLTPCCTI